MRYVRLTAHPAIGCAVASSRVKERRRFTWNCGSPWWSVHPAAPTTAAARRPLTSTTTRQTPTRPRPLTRPGWRTHTPRYAHAHPLMLHVNSSHRSRSRSSHDMFAIVAWKITETIDRNTVKWKSIHFLSTDKLIHWVYVATPTNYPSP